MGSFRSRIAVFALLGAVSILAGCATKDLENETRCSQGTHADCPQGTVARTESDYRRDVSAIDDVRCRAIAGDSADEYRKCLARYEKDRR